MNQTEQEFLNSLDKELWTAANKLLPVLAAADYKHAVLGLIFIRFTSCAFADRQKELREQFADENHEYFIDPDGRSPEEYEVEVLSELEERDYYKEKNVFWLPTDARWKFLQDNAPLCIGTVELDIDGEKKKIKSVGHLIDNALDTIERDNNALKGFLNKHYAQLKVDQAKLKDLINLIAKIPFNHGALKGKDILGHVYEYMLGEFALAEGKKGGQFYTPASIVSLIVEMIEPFEGRVYDPAMGSGGFFVQSEKFIESYAHQNRYDAIEQKQKVSIYGQEYNHTTWQLAGMNMVIRGLDFNFGKEPGDTFTQNQHEDLRADFIMANPPFNMKEWDVGVKDGDPRWKYGTPPTGNANFAWLQHMLYHLDKNGSQALLLANGSMSSNTNNEGEVRKELILQNKVECMVALPGQMFTNTQIPACIWFLTHNKNARTDKAGRKLRDRNNEVLFIDARNMGYMKDRVLKDFDFEKDTRPIADIFHAWKTGETVNGVTYEDQAGFCSSVFLEDIEKHDFVLTPGRYVGTVEEEDDGIPFGEKMATLTAKLSEQFVESATLEAEIKKNLAGLGYEF